MMQRPNSISVGFAPGSSPPNIHPLSPKSPSPLIQPGLGNGNGSGEAGGGGQEQMDMVRAAGSKPPHPSDYTFDETDQERNDVSCDNLLRVPVLSLVANQCPIVVEHTDSIAHVLKVLKENNILSAPVHSAETDRYIGLVDVLDLVVFLVSVSQGDGTATEQLKLAFQRPVYQVCGLSGTNPFFPIAECSLLEDALETFFAQGVHRLPIVDSFNRLRAMICQFDAVYFILRLEGAAPEFKNVLDMSLRALKLACKQTLVTVPTDEPLISCFALLALNKINGLGIVDSSGTLVGTLSAADLAGVTEEEWVDISMKVSDFVHTKVRQGSVICCKPEHTLRQMLQMAMTGQVHRVFVVDEAMKPISVVTFTDVLKVVIDRQTS